MLPRILVLMLAVPVIALSGCTRQTSATPAVAAPSASAPVTTAAAGKQTAPAGGLKGTLTIGVPCGLAMAYKEVRTLFLQQNPKVQLVDHVKNIGPMTKEVRDGKASLDVFLSLGEREIQTLTDAGIIDGKPVPFLRQSLQLCVQLGNPLGIKGLEDLAKPEIKTVAVCAPSLTIGNAGQKALESVGVWDKLASADKVVRPEQPAQAKELVINKKADATFIYAACSSKNWVEGDPERSVVGKADVVMTVPEKLYGGMFAVAAVLKTSQDPDLARKFVDFLLTPEAQEAVVKWGYGKLEGGPTGPETK